MGRSSCSRVGLGIAMVLMANPVRAAEPVIGHWLEEATDARIKMAVPDAAAFGGWQTSDLTYDSHNKLWWSIGDQNAKERPEYYPDRDKKFPHRGRYAYRITLSKGQPHAEAIPIWWKSKTVFQAVDRTFANVGTQLIDFEGIAADPTQPNTFLACTEGPQPWLVEMLFQDSPTKPQMQVIRSVQLDQQGIHAHNPASEAANTNWEGLAISPDGKELLLASEWNGAPARIYRLAMAEIRKTNWDGTGAAPQLRPQPWTTQQIAGAITGLCFLSEGGRVWLVALERNKPQLVVLDYHAPAKPAVIVPLDLRAPAPNGRPEGVKIKSASPEGIATDGAGRLLLIGDPAKSTVAERDFYKLIDQDPQAKAIEPRLNQLTPLVFELRSKDVLIAP